MNKSRHAHEQMHPPFTHMTTSCNTHISVTSQGIHMKTSDHTYECAKVYIWKHPVTLIDASSLTYECIACHTYRCVISLIWMCHVTQCEQTDPASSRHDCTATHCNTLQHTATHCSTLQHTAAHCNTLQHTATLQQTRCNTLQHIATQCNTMQQTDQASSCRDGTATPACLAATRTCLAGYAKCARTRHPSDQEWLHGNCNIHIYVYIERERCMHICMYSYVYGIYAYIHIHYIYIYEDVCIFACI